MAQLDSKDIALLDKFEFGFSCDGDLPGDKIEIVKATLEDFVATEKLEGRADDADAVLAGAILGKI